MMHSGGWRARRKGKSCSSSKAELLKLLECSSIKVIVGKRKVIFRKRKYNEMESKWEDHKQVKIKVNDTWQIKGYDAVLNYMSYSMVWRVVRADSLLQLLFSNTTLNFRKKRPWLRSELAFLGARFPVYGVVTFEGWLLFKGRYLRGAKKRYTKVVQLSPYLRNKWLKWPKNSSVNINLRTFAPKNYYVTLFFFKPWPHV